MKFRVLALACLVAGWLLPLSAQQRPQWMPGQSGLNAGVLPDPGFTWANMDVNYSASTLKDANGNTILRGSYNVWAIENIFIYVPNFKVLGGNLGFMVLVPTLANGSLSVPEFGAGGGGFGLADTWLQPFTLGWHLKRADIQVADALYLPTGRYTPLASDNIGYGDFGNHVTTGTTLYITKDKGTSANIFTDWEVHSNKNGTNVTPGQAFTTEWGLGQVLPLKKDFSKLLQLGIVGYDQWQVTANTGILAAVPFYSAHGAGIQANYILPAKGFSVFFKYYWQYKAIATSLGNTTAFGFNWTFPDPKPKPTTP